MGKNLLPGVIVTIIVAGLLVGIMTLEDSQFDQIKQFNADIKKAKEETSVDCGELAVRVVTPGSSLHENPITILFGQVLRDDMDYRFILHKENRLVVIAIPQNQPSGQQRLVAQKNLPSSDYCINKLAR